MSRCKIAGALGVLLLVSSAARAQDIKEPDVRDIPPFVMLVVDSSGSMEDLPACTCASPTDCSNCQPGCHLVNTFGEPPKTADGHEAKKNRWAVTLEALTGKFKDFECTPLARTAANGMTYDENYSIPYHQPWKCGGGGACPYPGPDAQETNGILDSYKETLRFGLMTFDGEYTYKGGSDLINEASFNTTLSEGIEGMWSYGGKRPVRYPGCTDLYYVDSGARGITATEGKLITLNSDQCTTPPCDFYQINSAIQDALLKTRPYGGTPIAASLFDLYEHLKTDVEDEFKACRPRYGILITDGAPDPDFRDLRCHCGDEDPTVPCGGGLDGSTFECPYPLAQDVAKKLVAGDGTADNPKQLDKLFVLGMSVQDADARLTLDKIANAGLTDKALQADDPNTLRSTLDNVFSPLLRPISRSVPGFATGITGIQYQVSTGFQITASSLSSEAPPWTGLIERRRFVCNPTSGQLEEPALESSDLFQNVINTQSVSRRRLWTATPSVSFVPADVEKKLATGSSTCSGETCRCDTSGCREVDLNSVEITKEILTTTEAQRTALINWMYGPDSIRKDRRLGDIYHSSPTLVGAPMDEPADDAYTRFRSERPEVKERPLVMYVASNDGILHAISVEDYPATGYPLTKHASHPLVPLKAGEELWGFVPPILLPKLKHQLASHQFNLDATPVVKDVFFKRGDSASETEYHSVLIMGMRGGGNAYFALDVTDPLEPKFLWQFTDDEMGKTYGQPEIVQATFNFADVEGQTPTLQTRAVAILSGGQGVKKNVDSSPADLVGCTFDKRPSMKTSGGTPYESWRAEQDDTGGPNPAKHRGSIQCWERTGRALYFVDVQTGRLIKKVVDSDLDPGNGGYLFPSPLIGTPTAYQDAVATIADRGFVMDADGVLWRIDMRSQNVEKDKGLEGWTVRPFHDLFWDKDVPSGGELSHERPILSLDEKRRLVVIVGTGDTDNFSKPNADNRVVSLTEVTSQEEPDEPEDFHAKINWELRNEGDSGNALVSTELVTGSMALFEGQLFVSTFIANLGGTDACDYGRGRLWSLDYVKGDPSDKNVPWDSGGPDPETLGPMRIPVVDEALVDTNGELFNIKPSAAKSNLLIQGIGTTQRQSCTPPDPDPLNSYFAPSLANIVQNDPPAIWVVAQASRGDQRKGSALGSVQTKVQRRITFSRVMSWASSVD